MRVGKRSMRRFDANLRHLSCSVGLAASLILGGCDKIQACLSGDNGQIGATATIPEAVHVPLWPLYYADNVCPKNPTPGMSPSEYELSEFLDRTKTGKFTKAININCVIYVYSPMALHEWQDKGDPVAALAIVLWNEKSTSSVCTFPLADEQNLRRATEVKIYQPALKRSLSRLPEAYDVIDTLRLNCNEIHDPTNRKMAEAQGFYIDELIYDPLH